MFDQAPALLPAAPGQNYLARAWRAVSFQEGLRAAFAIAAVLALGELLRWPPLLIAALGSLFTCMGDVGGPIRARIPALVTLGLLGGLAYAVFGTLRGVSDTLAIVTASIAIFAMALGRVYGQRSMAVGNLLIVITVLALDRPLPWQAAGIAALSFMAGSAWALLLTMVIWRVQPYLPVRRAVANAYRALGAEADDLRKLLLQGLAAGGTPDWDAHRLGYRRAVRDAIEQARDVLMQTIGARWAAAAPRVSRVLIRLEDADQIFGAMIGISELLEAEPEAQRCRAVAHMLRRVAPMLRVLAEAAEQDLPRPVPRVMRVLDEIQDEAAHLDPSLRHIALLLTDRLRIAATLTAPEGFLDDSMPQVTGWRDRVLNPLRANLNQHSAAFRHAVRGALVAAPALWISMSAGTPYAHWFTITLVLTMQPFFAFTLQRAIQRIAGTVAGGIAAGLVAAFMHSPTVLAIALFPLAIVTLSVRAVSFGLFMACLTPLVVLLTELGSPGGDPWEVLKERALFTLAGGALAVLGNWLIWPSWEPRRLANELATAVRAHALLLEAALSETEPTQTEAARHRLEQAKRVAGRASNNLEASIARAAREPAHVRIAGLEAVMAVDAALRRLAGLIVAVALGGALQPHEPDSIAWRDYLADRLRAAVGDPPSHGGERPDPPAPPNLPCPAPLGRPHRQVALITGAMPRAGL